MVQSFGGSWTLLKLEILEKYLESYTKALKKQNFKLCYIDAFAGSGNVEVREYGTIIGSALRALDYQFDKYYYIEKKPSYLEALKDHINQKKTGKDIQLIQGDCNELLNTINSYPWKKAGWRGVIFLDPCAMELSWSSLESIAETEVFDVWYLFPISALNRVLPKHKAIPPSTRELITDLLGTDEWENEIYVESPQITMFDDTQSERISFNGITAYVIRRLHTIFQGVSSNPKILRQPHNNSPMFVLCFAVSNPSPKAIGMSLRLADHILTHTNPTKGKGEQYDRQE
ncbi:MAG: three-Cys-motif partner protein TcmP [Desulfitobacteriia bacterium]